MAIPTSRILRPSLPSATCDVTRSLFAASAPCHLRAPVARFSTSPSLWKGDNNKNRGRSAVRRTGVRPRQTLSVREKDFAAQQLPKPVEPTSKITGDPDHGLYEFFRNKELLRTPADEARHGMAVCRITMAQRLTLEQVEHGQSTNCATAIGKRYSSFGGFASRSATALPRRNSSTRGRRPAMVGWRWITGTRQCKRP